MFYKEFACILEICDNRLNSVTQKAIVIAEVISLGVCSAAYKPINK